MQDNNRKVQVEEFEEYIQSDDGDYGSLRVQAARLVRSIAEASDAGWECLAVTPYRLKSDGDASTVEEYLLLLWIARVHDAAQLLRAGGVADDGPSAELLVAAIERPALAIQVAERLALLGIGHHDELPTLAILCLHHSARHAPSRRESRAASPAMQRRAVG
jgi:hypothetical protein